MAAIRVLPNGKYHTDIRKNQTFIQAKTFNTKQQAEQYACDIESNIDSVLSIIPQKIKNFHQPKCNYLDPLPFQARFLTFPE